MIFFKLAMLATCLLGVGMCLVSIAHHSSQALRKIDQHEAETT